MSAFALLLETTTRVWAVAIGILAGALLGGCALLGACAVAALWDWLSVKRRERAQRQGESA